MDIREELNWMTGFTDEEMVEETKQEIFDEWDKMQARITELEQQLAEAQPLIELGLETQQAQEQAQMEVKSGNIS
jgi:hypothetical protein